MSVPSGPANVCAWLCACSSTPEPTLAPLALLPLTSSSHGWDSAPCWKPQAQHKTRQPGSIQAQWPSAAPLSSHLQSRVRKSTSRHTVLLFGNEKAPSQYSLFMGYFVRKKIIKDPRPCNAPFLWPCDNLRPWFPILTIFNQAKQPVIWKEVLPTKESKIQP